MLAGRRKKTQEEPAMANKGFSHVGLSTLDMDKTRAFYEGILGFKPVIADTIKIKEGGAIRHIFFDTGRDQLLAFMEPRGVPGVPLEYDAGINRGLGVPAAFYHFAFEAGSEAGLEAKRKELAAKGVEVTDIVDHNWAKSIYFKDPNGISLEYCCLVRDFVEDDASMQDRFEISVKALGLNQNEVGEVTQAQSHSYKAKS
jgi:catechol 2,3-dioxygenase-like lactoylglutathione lyase family enzyme